MTIKAISLWQPWASLVAFGEKKVETRCWTTKYRGPIAIASTAAECKNWLGTSRFGAQFCIAMLEISERLNWGDWYWPSDHKANREGIEPLRNYEDCQSGKLMHAIEMESALRGIGAVLCIADLVAIEETTRVREDLSERELLFGNYDDGRYAWFLENVRRLKQPVPTKGRQRLWNWQQPENLNLCSGGH